MDGALEFSSVLYQATERGVRNSKGRLTATSYQTIVKILHKNGGLNALRHTSSAARLDGDLGFDLNGDLNLTHNLTLLSGLLSVQSTNILVVVPGMMCKIIVLKESNNVNIFSSKIPPA